MQHDNDNPITVTLGDPGTGFAIDSIRATARLLREAKEAHTEWEAKFEGHVPAHDWEVWYAQYIELKIANAAAGEVAQQFGITSPVVKPLDMAKLHTLVGPLA